MVKYIVEVYHDSNARKGFNIYTGSVRFNQAMVDALPESTNTKLAKFVMAVMWRAKERGLDSLIFGISSKNLRRMTA